MLVCKRDLEIIKHIVSFANPDLSIVTRQGDTILHLAAKYNSVEVLSFLLSMEVLSINARDHSLDTCLHVAVRESRLNTIEFLLSHQDIDIHLVNIHGQDPCTVAAYNRNFEVIRIFVTCGKVCPPTVRTRQNDTCLHLAAQNNNLSMLHYSLKYIDVNSVNCNLETAFFIAVKHSNLAIMEHLKKAGSCNINARNKSGDSPLHVAIRQNSIKIAQTLVGFKCDLNLKNIEGLTPLHIAVRNCNDAAISTLISNPNCDILACTKEGENIFHIAALNNYPSIFSHIDPRH